MTDGPLIPFPPADGFEEVVDLSARERAVGGECQIVWKPWSSVASISGHPVKGDRGDGGPEKLRYYAISGGGGGGGSNSTHGFELNSWRFCNRSQSISFFDWLCVERVVKYVLTSVLE